MTKKTIKEIKIASILIHLDFLSISKMKKYLAVGLVASILIHLDFLSILCKYINSIISVLRNCFNPYSSGFSIYLNFHVTVIYITVFSFNPYSSGFSIYLDGNRLLLAALIRLQSLFIWIFYLFKY